MTDQNDTVDERAREIAASVRDRASASDGGSSEQSRRRFLNNSVLAGGALVALGGGSGFALANEHDDDPAAMKASFDDVAGTDIDVLNYALTLEHLEDVFYRDAIEMFGEEDFVNAEALSGMPEQSRRDAWSQLQVIGQHESTHVEVLTDVVSLLGGDPAQEGTYDFGVETVGDVISLGAVFENTGVAAYAGAAPYIESPDLLSSALAIHSVEARHAAVLNTLNGESPFPGAFDSAAAQQEVLDAVGDFIESAPGTDTPGGNETDTPGGNETDTPGGNETDTPGGSGEGNGTDGSGA